MTTTSSPCNNIILIGFMGSGKSTIGAVLAQELGTFLLDTDMILQATFKNTISDFFSLYGEAVFRQQEGKLIQWLAKNTYNAIIATGGGMPIFHDVKQMGVVVFLSIGFEQIFTRLDSSAIASRPLFQDKNHAYDLFLARQSLYTKSADIIINANQSPEKVAKDIINTMESSVKV